MDGGAWECSQNWPAFWWQGPRKGIFERLDRSDRVILLRTTVLNLCAKQSCAMRAGSKLAQWPHSQIQMNSCPSIPLSETPSYVSFPIRHVRTRVCRLAARGRHDSRPFDLSGRFSHSWSPDSQDGLSILGKASTPSTASFTRLFGLGEPNRTQCQVLSGNSTKT